MPWVNPATRSTGYSVTAANWNEVANDLGFLAEVNYTEFTSDVSITATTVGTANQVVSAGAITYEAVPHMLEFWCARYTGPAQVTNVILRDGSTVIGTVANVQASGVATPFYVAIRRTPTAASHTYNFAAWLGGAATGTFKAGSGGAAGDGSTFMPGWIRVTRIPT